MSLPTATAPDPAAERGAPLAAAGIHRDAPATGAAPLGRATFAQRVVQRFSDALAGRRSSRRSFLTKTAVVGSALAVGPLDFILKPGTAYGYLCGTCTDGWTAFCCTVNNGRNACPAGSFVAGWWKADNAAYCCGSARYIIDCNATCPTQCQCRCGGNSCDNRRTCCNQFRYGQCHTEIACYGPVVCRVATCVPPWVYDKSCTTTVRTDNRTTDHGAPCLTKDCGSPIAKKYAALGGPKGIMGALVQAEHAVGDGRGRRARYRNGNIYWTASTGAREVRAGRLSAYTTGGGPTGPLGYPTRDTFTSRDGAWLVNDTQYGRLLTHKSSKKSYYLAGGIFYKHQSLGGLTGVLGRPMGNQRRAKEGRSLCQDFAKGRIYVLDWNWAIVAIHGKVYDAHQATGGVTGPLRYPLADQVASADGRGGHQSFEGGRIYHSGAGAHALRGPILDKYLADGASASVLGYPKGGHTKVGDGAGEYVLFENGGLWSSPASGTWRVHGRVLPWYLARGGALSDLGYPTSDLGGTGPQGRVQEFQHGSIAIAADGTITVL